MKTRCLLLILLVNILGYSLADEAQNHKLVKRQSPPRSGARAFPLSRSRQFPPPEELEESEEYVNSEDEEEDGDRSAASPFRGRQPQRPPSEEEYSEDYSFTEAPKKTTPSTPKPTARTVVFNNRFAARPRFGSVSSTSSTTTTPAPKPSTATTSRSRSRATPAQSQRFDVVANILNKPPPARQDAERSISISSSRTSNLNTEKKPDISSEAPSVRNANNRQRPRGRFRPRTSTTTTTTTTTTTAEPPLEEYYYYYEDDEAQKNQPIATTTSTTTTTTPRPPSLPKQRLSVGRRPSRSTAKPVVKFDPESQFLPPPEDLEDALSAPASTKRFTTSSTTTAEPGSPAAAIPPHLRSKYKPRTDGRFIDFLRDPNRPRELKGFDLTDYPFYVKVPEDIDFECEDKKDGYYASVPHKCQLFHYCFAGARYDFLCANYTLYDQTTFTCRFANNVDCESSAKYYYRNDDLWKETTTPAPETTTPKKRRTTPKEEEEYDDDYDYEESDEEEEERRRRPAKRRRNRRKNRRKPQESQE